MGLDFDMIHSGIEEEGFPQDESPKGHVIRLSEAKAIDVGRRYTDHWVVAADTIVTIDDAILGKPRNQQEAVEMLHRLSGREHCVVTGFSVLHLGKGKGDREAVQTSVKMKSLTPAEVAWYVATGEPFDKAGGYAIQGMGSFMIESIRGSYTNVVGLPLCELIQMMNRLGAIAISESGFRVAE